MARLQVFMSSLPLRRALPASNKFYTCMPWFLGLRWQEGWHEAHQVVANGCTHVLKVFQEVQERNEPS